MRAALGLVMVTATVAIASLFLLPPLVGYQRYVIAGGSMEPSIHRGSIAYEKVVPVTDLRRGDVITYVRPGASQPVTHRILAIGQRNGGAVVRTKGDANPDPDFEPVQLKAGEQARVAYHVPYAGWPLIWLADTHLRIWLLGGAALAMVGGAMASLWREGGRVTAET